MLSHTISTNIPRQHGHRDATFSADFCNTLLQWSTYVLPVNTAVHLQ